MKGEYSSAEPDLAEAIRLAPSFGAPHLNLGNIFYNRKVFKEALKLYNRAVEIEPGEAKNFYCRANCLRDLGDFEAALKDYDQSVMLDPRFQNCFCNRGDLHRRLGEAKLAEKDFSIAIRLDPADGKARFNLALAYLDQHMPTKAFEAIDKYIQMEPTDGGGYLLRALARLHASSEIASIARNPREAFSDIVEIRADLKKASLLGERNAEDLLSFIAGALKGAGL